MALYQSFEDKFLPIDTDCWYRISMERKNSFQYTWCISNFRQCCQKLKPEEWLESLRFKGSESSVHEWWLRLTLKDGSISFGIGCSEPSVFAVYQASVVNNNGDLENITLGKFTECVVPLLETELLNQPTMSLLKGDRLTIHCSITECGSRIVELWERPIFHKDISNDFAFKKLCEDLNALYENKRLSDVTFKFPFSSKTFYGHKDILSARSPYFKDSFLKDDLRIPSNESLALPDMFPESSIKKTKEKIINCILRYVYSNNHEDITKNNWMHAYSVAKSFYIAKLKVICTEVAMNHINLMNYHKLLHFAATHEDHQFQLKIQNFISCIPREMSRKKNILNEEALKFIPEEVKSETAGKEDNFQEPSLWSGAKWCNTVILKRNITLSIENFNNFSSFDETVNEFPDFKIDPNGEFKFKVFARHNQITNEKGKQDILRQHDLLYITENGMPTHHKALYVQLKSLCDKSKVKVHYQFSILCKCGEEHFTPEYTESPAGKFKSVCLIADQSILDHPDLISNNILTIRCYLTVYFNQEKTCFQDTMGNSLREDMRSLLETEELGDFIFRCNGEEIRVHKYIMLSRSNRFNIMQESSTGMIDIVDTEISVLKVFLLYIYTGVVEDINLAMAMQLLKLDQQFYVNGLENICLNYLCSIINIHNVFNLIVFANTWDYWKLERHASRFISFHLSTIKSKYASEWNDFMHDNQPLVCEVIDAL